MYINCTAELLNMVLKQKGKTYSEVLEQCRLEQACLLLADPGISVREVRNVLRLRLRQVVRLGTVAIQVEESGEH